MLRLLLRYTCLTPGHLIELFNNLMIFLFQTQSYKQFYLSTYVDSLPFQQHPESKKMSRLE